MDDADVRRALRRIAHEIIERHRGLEDVVVLGIHTRGAPLARRLAADLERFESVCSGPVCNLLKWGLWEWCGE